ncbi:MAG: hypothetical protein FE041_00015 [Thermoplasmata archaeon]|nr:MAG: hypothetical protein FE041_00015 [Thermoplasmata archaeon]
MRKAFFVIVGISLLISGILLALGKVENDYICKPCIAGGACPPNPGPVGTRQPNYDGKRFGLNGWRCHTQQIKGDDGKTHKIELWCLDRIKDTDKQGNIVAGGDEYLVWICDGKPVGKCPSDGGENRGGKKAGALGGNTGKVMTQVIRANGIPKYGMTGYTTILSKRIVLWCIILPMEKKIK